MSAADLFAARVDDILNSYHRALEDSESSLIASAERWQQCRAQAEAILHECTAALHGNSLRQRDVLRRTKELGVRRALQRIPIAESIRAGYLLWRATTPVLREVLLTEPGEPGEPGERTSTLLNAFETLHQSISIRLQAGALAHEDAHLVRRLLSGDDTNTGPGLLPFSPSDDDFLAAKRLTAREQQVLAGVAKGLSNRGIGRKLGIAEGTVKRHMRRIFTKLGAVSRVDAINKAGMTRPRIAAYPHDAGDHFRSVAQRVETVSG